MKTLFAAVSAIGLLAASPAYAQSAEGEIALNATVAPACGVGNHLSGASSASGWGQSDLTVNLANGNGQFNGKTYNDRSFGNVWCNTTANVTISVAALTSTNADTTTDTGSFTDRFDVRVVTDAGVYIGAGEDYEISTVGTGGVVTVGTGTQTTGAFETGLKNYGGADVIEILKDPLNRRAVAGDYSGYVKFSASVS